MKGETVAPRIPQVLRRHWTTLGLWLTLAASLLMKLRNLDHRLLTYWDESFHALVARNLLRHPLRFTLIDQPYLAYDYRDWTSNHIWLHKPPVALWLIAGSYAVLGVHAFALRVPSLLLSTGAVALTYLIGAELFGRRAGLIAAFWHAFNPFTFSLVHGYAFSDHIDIALLFWLELSCYFLVRAARTGEGRFAVGSGIAQALAYLSKSYLGCLPFGIVLALWLSRRLGVFSERDLRINLRHVLLQALATVLLVAPWVAYCLSAYPREFLHEHGAVLRHLTTEVENWGGTWDRPVFDYLVGILQVIYSGALAATIVLLVRQVLPRARRTWPELFLLFWILGAVVPLSLADSKTPSALVIAMPAMILAFARLIDEGLSRPSSARLWLATAVVLLVFPGGASTVSGQRALEGADGWAPFLAANAWIAWRLLGIAGLTAVLGLVSHLKWRERQHRWIVIASAALTLGLGAMTIQRTKWIGNPQADSALWETLGRDLRERFGPESCFFLEGYELGDHQRLMFTSGRTVYDARSIDADASAAEVAAAGGVPYRVTRDARSEEPVYDGSPRTGYRVYRLLPE